MDPGSNLMDWEPASPPALPNTSPSNHSIPTTEGWEPEIPGQFNTPPRIRRQRIAEEALRTSRKRTANEAGFTSQSPSTEHREPVMVAQVSLFY
jgi:hypothetical protein